MEALCQRYGALPSQVLAEPASLMQHVARIHAASGAAVEDGAPVTPSMEQQLAESMVTF